MVNGYIKKATFLFITYATVTSVAQINSNVTKIANTKSLKTDSISTVQSQSKATALSMVARSKSQLNELLKKSNRIRPDLKKALGGVNGGGGTSVQLKNAKAFVLWDLFANNPSYSEQATGDYIQPTASHAIESVKYSSFRSFQILKDRLSLLESNFPRLFDLINHDGFLEGKSTLPLFSTTLYVKNPEELFRKYDYWPEGATLSPFAHYDEETNYIYMNVNIWNHMGPDSQAGFLLHERLRQIQVNHKELSNEIIQGIVSYVIDPTFSNLMEFVPNDEFFKFKVAIQASLIFKITPEDRFEQLLKMGFFSRTQTKLSNPTTVGNKNFITTSRSQDLISNLNDCETLISGFEAVINSFRAKLNCADHGMAQGTLAGTGELYFQTPLAAKKISIEIEASLYSPNDGGSEIGINFYKNNTLSEGIKTRIANYGQPHISTNLKNANHPLLNDYQFTWQIMKSYNIYRLTIDRESGIYSVYMITDHQNVLLASSTISDEIDLRVKNLFWSFSINNNSIVKKIKIKQ